MINVLPFLHDMLVQNHEVCLTEFTIMELLKLNHWNIWILSSYIPKSCWICVVSGVLESHDLKVYNYFKLTDNKGVITVSCVNRYCKHSAIEPLTISLVLHVFITDILHCFRTIQKEQMSWSWTKETLFLWWNNTMTDGSLECQRGQRSWVHSLATMLKHSGKYGSLFC